MRVIYRRDCPLRSKGMLCQVGQHPALQDFLPHPVLHSFLTAILSGVALVAFGAAKGG